MSDEQANDLQEQREMGMESEANERRRRYRLTVHRIAHARLRDELAIGLSGRLATWIALRETTAHCSLSRSESACLFASLQAAAEQTGQRP
ncbi:MAG: hypothetical protein ACYDAR_04895 [Thermomicrobiales bacterium]